MNTFIIFKTYTSKQKLMHSKKVSKFLFCKIAVLYVLSKKLENNCTKINVSVILQGFFHTNAKQAHSRTAFYRSPVL